MDVRTYLDPVDVLDVVSEPGGVVDLALEEDAGDLTICNKGVQLRFKTVIKVLFWVRRMTCFTDVVTRHSFPFI